MSFPLPANESSRIRDLRDADLLHTPAEDVFDAFAEIAAAVMQTPIAMISLVGEDFQWFKAKVGVDVCSTARSASFCTHAILETRPLIVRDALLDDRFKDSPLVTGPPYVRFYAGAPLYTHQGHAIGSLCAIDTVPRDPTETQIQLLERMAIQVMELVEARRTASTIARQLRRIA